MSETELTEDRIPLIGLLKYATQEFGDELRRRLREAGFADIRDGHGCVFGNIPPEGARLTELAERARLTKQAVGECASDLERIGYLERVPDPTDGRAKILRLTPRGREAQDAGNAFIAEIEAEWSERHGEDEVAALRRVLEEVVGTPVPA
jgi:DNA-binding MarR family transcriptional regulator